MIETKRALKEIYDALEDKKAMDIRIIDISKISVIADYFVIASGANINQVQAMSDNVDEAMGKVKENSRQIEGYATGNWILMDFNDIIVHIFDKDARGFYNLDKIWHDGIEVNIEEL